VECSALFVWVNETTEVNAFDTPQVGLPSQWRHPQGISLINLTFML